LRDRHARDDEGSFVCEGPASSSAALEHGAHLLECLRRRDVESPDVRAVRAARRRRARLQSRRRAVGDTDTPQAVSRLAGCVGLER
jgi:hypothetical protein